MSGSGKEGGNDDMTRGRGPSAGQDAHILDLRSSAAHVLAAEAERTSC